MRALRPLRFNRIAWDEREAENYSRRQGMSHAVIEGFGRPVPAQAQDLPAGDPGQAPCAGGQPEAQRPDAAQGVRGGPFPRPRLGESRRLDLETPYQVLGQEAELWLGAVGPGVIRGDHVQGTLALALAQGLPLGVPPVMKSRVAGPLSALFVGTAGSSKGASSGQKRSRWNCFWLSGCTRLREVTRRHGVLPSAHGSVPSRDPSPPGAGAAWSRSP